MMKTMTGPGLIEEEWEDGRRCAVAEGRSSGLRVESVVDEVASKRLKRTKVTLESLGDADWSIGRAATRPLQSAAGSFYCSFSQVIIHNY